MDARMAEYTATMAAEAGAGERFSDLLEAHRRIVFKVANTYCWHAEDRADLSQEIVAQLWRAFSAYDPTRPFSTWMYRIALNVAISSLRRRRQETRTVPLDEAVHDIADHRRHDPDADERTRALYRVIDRLEPLNRALLLLYLDERSYREIAEILGISETNVATKLNRLKARIREDIGGVTP
jgi:RNA polymerase sigma-70 factor (ECF subfamily)